MVLFLYGVGPFFGIPPIGSTKRVIHLLDRSYSARPVANRLLGFAPLNEKVAVFRVRRDMEYGLAFYRNHEVVNYEENGVPDEQHLLVARVTGRNGVDLLAGAGRLFASSGTTQGFVSETPPDAQAARMMLSYSRVLGTERIAGWVSLSEVGLRIRE